MGYARLASCAISFYLLFIHNFEFEIFECNAKETNIRIHTKVDEKLKYTISQAQRVITHQFNRSILFATKHITSECQIGRRGTEKERIILLYNPVLSSFITYHRVCKYSNTTGATSGVGTTEAREFIPGFRVCVDRSLVFYVVFCRSQFALFVVDIVLSNLL